MKYWLRLLHPFGKVITYFSVVMFVPIFFSLYEQDKLFFNFLICGLSTLAIGKALTILGANHQKTLQFKHGFLLLTIIWLAVPLIASMPLYLSLQNLYPGQYSYPQALFETVSGLTASGGTVITGLDDLPSSVNFWRMFTSWLGGMGFIILATAIFPYLGIGGLAAAQNELPGQLDNLKLSSNISETARMLWICYAVLTAICAIFYYLAGMSLFDAITHAFTTLSLGGFSTHDANFAYFDSPAIDAIAIIFMLIAGMNFLSHILFWHNRSLTAYRRDPELGYYAMFLVGSIVIAAAVLLSSSHYPDIFTTIRYTVFNTVSIVTTTGYSNSNYNLWPIWLTILLLCVASCASCSGSTGGGIKVLRIRILCKCFTTEATKLLHPDAYYHTTINKQILPNKLIVTIMFFTIIYILSILVLFTGLLATGLDMLSAFSAALATMSNTGPGLGMVGPNSNYASLSNPAILMCSLGMLAGRLEILVLLIVFRVNFWRFN